MRSFSAGHQPQIVYCALGKRLGAGGAKTPHSHRVLRCDFPALLRSDLFKVCLQHRKLLDVCSWKVVVYMYIFTLTQAGISKRVPALDRAPAHSYQL